MDAQTWFERFETVKAIEDGSEYELIESLPEEQHCLDDEIPDNGSIFAIVFDDGSAVVVDMGTMGDAFVPLGWYLTLDEAKITHGSPSS